MCAKKASLSEYKSFIDSLANEDWIKRSERRWWPHFLFHYTDIRNAVEILKSDFLFSRDFLEKTGALAISSGSSSVLSTTNQFIKNSVRLYFRPRTPTQFHMEGIRSKDYLQKSKYPDAHCPVPIFFLFDSSTVLSMPNCQFSNGNLGSPHAQLYSSLVDLKELPWKSIYHNKEVNLVERGKIVFHRNAEVVVPEKLPLAALKFVYCRSDAERETLLNLLPADIKKRRQGKIVSTTKSDLFFRKHTYIESVRLIPKQALIQFSPETSSSGPFEIYYQFSDALGTLTSNKEIISFENSSKIICNLPRSSLDYTFKVFIDSHLAYSNSYESYDMPF